MNKIQHQIYMFLKNKFLLFSMLLALIMYLIQSIAYPVYPGRDFATYLMYFYDYLNETPIFHTLMLFRTPVTPLILGGLFSIGGIILVKIFLCILYVLLIPAFYYIGNFFNTTISKVFVIFMIFYVPYCELFHEVSSDNIFLFIFVYWVAHIFYSYKDLIINKTIFNAFLLFLLILTRPSAQIFLMSGLFILITNKAFKKKIINFSIFYLIIVSLLLIYATHNQVKYNDFTISRGTNLHLPFYRIFSRDKIVLPENGPYTKKLAKAVKEDLLKKEPYFSKKIDIKTFFQGNNNHRYFGDIPSLVDRTWGWNSDHIILKKISYEAILSHPTVFIKQSILYYFYVLTMPFVVKAPLLHGETSNYDQEQAELIVDYIPHNYFSWQISNPKNIYITENKRDKLKKKVNKISGTFPKKSGINFIALILNFVTIIFYPSILMLLFFSLIFSLKDKENRNLILFFVFYIIVYTFINSLVVNTLHYRLPIDFLAILFGINGILKLFPVKTSSIKMPIFYCTIIILIHIGISLLVNVGLYNIKGYTVLTGIL